MYVSATYIYIHICDHVHVCPSNEYWPSHVALRWRKKEGALGADMWPTKIGAVTLTYAGIGATQTYCELTGHCDSLGGDMWRTVIAVSSTAPLATAGAW